MPSRAELKQICEELELEHDKLSIDEMKEAIRARADKRWSKYSLKNVKLCPTYTMSKELLKFLTEEYDYSLFDKQGNKVDVGGNILKEAKRES